MIIGVDTGGTKTLVSVFSKSGQVMAQQKFATPKDIHIYVEQVMASIFSLVENRSEILGIAIAAPGIIKDQKIIICKNLGWRNIDILALLQTNFPDIPMWLENDANLGGLGAANLLATPPARCLYITISTGIGGGFIVNQNISKDMSICEVGDMILDYNSYLVSWEDLASGSAIIKDFGVYASELTEQSAIDEVADRISRGLMVLIPVFSPDIVALGGGVGAHYQMFSDRVSQALKGILPAEYSCPIITAPYPEEIVVYGCYFYAKNQLNLS